MLTGVKTQRQIIWITILLSLSITVVSLVLTVLLHHVSNTEIGYLGIFSAIIAPTLIAPPIIYKFLDIICQLRLAHELLESLSQEDYLTGVYNRRHLEETATKEFSLGQRHKFPVSIMILDIDYFKQTNDTYGHLVGDQVLIELTQYVYEMIRETDIFGRYGGEEFILFMPHTALDDAVMLSERIRQAIADRKFQSDTDNARINITVSVGVASATPKTKTLEDLMLNADLALYRAKELGRNRVEVYDGPS
jgi:diguanylate cyclase (GGDEF)-like protein